MAITDSDLIPVVDYARASADRAGDEHTVTDQQTVNGGTAARLGCRIVARFKDNDKSAAKEGVIRDDFEKMLKVLKAGQLPDGTPVMGCIVVADDRLVRRAGDYERFVDAITYEDGRVFADKRGFKDLYSEDVESMGLMGAVFSRMEVKKMRRRARQWHQTRAQEGTKPAGPRPFGWKADRITLDLAEAALLRGAVEAFIAGRSLNSVVADWQRKGVITPRGNNWQANPLKQTLQNPRLCGWRRIKGELVTGRDGRPVVGEWEPIIEPEQWEAVQAIFGARKGMQVLRSGEAAWVLPRDHREHKYLLGGLLRCGRILADGTMCGAKLKAAQMPDRKYGHRYMCPGKTSGGCGSLSRRGDKVDEFISEAVLAKLEQRTAAARQNLGPWPGQRELNERTEQLQELKNRILKRTISNTVGFDLIEGLEPEIARLRRERQSYMLATQQAAADVTDIRRRWYSETDEDRLDVSQKRAYIREAFHAVIVHPAGKGHGARKTFNADLLEPVWREDA